MTDYHALETPEGRRAEYDRLAALLTACARWARAHVDEDPDCGAAPLCIGDGVELLSLTASAGGPGTERLINLVAVGEIARITAELDTARAELADVAAQAMRMDAELLDAHGHLGTVLDRLAEIEAELRQWNDAADVVGPVHPAD
jgi:hypothetical protein